MRILIGLTYYRPHYSGLTIYTERLARALVEHGHQVTVLTSRYLPHLPARETTDGVQIVRPWVLMRVSKGVLMPGIPIQAWRAIREADIVNVHVPQLDAAPISILAKLMGKPVLMTYHCDLRLPEGFIHQVANVVSHGANHVTARVVDAIVTNTRDYAEQSRFLKHYLTKVRVIPPPSILPSVSEADVRAFREKFQVRPGQPIIGMVARLATEKGVEYLIQAMPDVLEKFPDARVLFVGQYQDVLGEEKYAARLAPLVENLGEHWSFLGVLDPVELAVFYRECSLTVLPSINVTESFGMVQIESMSSGTPVVATDLPGVRQPVRSTGMGRVVPPGDSQALAHAILDLLVHPTKDLEQGREVACRYAPENIAAEYEKIFKELVRKSRQLPE